MRWSESSLGIETLLTVVIALTSNMTVTQNICRSRWRTASRRPEWTLLTALHKALTYLSVGWSEGWGPCQRTTKSGGFDEKRVGWDASGDVWETCWKLKWLQAVIPPPQKNTQLTVSISEAKCLKKKSLLYLKVIGEYFKNKYFIGLLKMPYYFYKHLKCSTFWSYTLKQVLTQG